MIKIPETIFQNLITPNEGYKFLFRDDIYIPIYRNELLITKREVIKLDLVQEKVLQIIDLGIYRVDEISRILGLERRILEITIADLTTQDLISATADSCRLLKKGNEALKTLERSEKRQDRLQDVYIDGLSGSVIQDVSEYSVIDRVNFDDNKLHANVLSDDINAIKKQFSAVKEIFELQFSNVELAEGINTLQQELLTIDNIERTFVQFIRFPICVFVSSNGLDIDITAVNGKQKEALELFKDEIIRQINYKMVLRNHFREMQLRKSYSGSLLEMATDYHDKLKQYFYLPNKTNKETKEIESLILSSRMLVDGEKDIIIQFLAEPVDTIELFVDNLDDWAFSTRFVSELSRFIGKTKLQVYYSRCRDIEKAKKRIKRGGDFNIKFTQKEYGYFICWHFGKYRVYGLPEKKKVINDHTSAVVTKYYLEKIET